MRHECDIAMFASYLSILATNFSYLNDFCYDRKIILLSFDLYAVAGRSMVRDVDRLLRRHLRRDNRRRLRDGDYLLGVRPVELPQRHGVHAGHQTERLLATVLAPDYPFAHDRHSHLHDRYVRAAHVRRFTVSRLRSRSVKTPPFFGTSRTQLTRDAFNEILDFSFQE